MIIRILDSSHDWTFGKGIQDYYFKQNAIAENIQTRLLSFFNDCFFDYYEGIDWLRLLGTPGTKQEITLTCRAKILQSVGVLRVNSLNVFLREENRAITLSFNIDTVYTSNFLQSLEVAL